MLTWVDKSRAIAIALRFFEQHHSDIFLKDVILDVDVWIVTVSIGRIDNKIRQIKIDVNDGKILGISDFIKPYF